MKVGSLIATGRDCDIYSVDHGRILRRARDGHSLEPEVAVMRHAGEHGFPVPEVFEVAGPDMVMERLDGPNLLEDVARRPWRLRSHARLLADLHRQLAAVKAPEGLAEAEGCPGDRLLHLDLHPLNVILTDRGPRVIDWTTARRGAPGADVANTWLLVASATAEGNALMRATMSAGRRLFLRVFLNRAGRAQARPYLPAVLGYAKSCHSMYSAELRRMDRLVAQENAPPRS
jgi:aminoglycoside phosphotransferase (APT) family kinase protein